MIPLTRLSPLQRYDMLFEVRGKKVGGERAMQSEDMRIPNDLLLRTGSIMEKYETIARETGSSFNIFDIANIETDERKMCRILHELLSPKGRHGQGGAYLALFMRDCMGLPFDENAQVHREYRTDANRSIDIVIEAGGRFHPIEVKIGTGEGYEQCSHYYEFALSKNGGKDTQLYYLTKYGEPPTEETSKALADDEKIRCLSFSDDVLDWLKQCLALPDTIRKAPIREILLQLVSTIEKITNQSEDKEMNEIVQLLSASAQHMRSAKAIVDSYEQCRMHMAKRFFEALHEGLKDRLGDTLHAFDEKASEGFLELSYVGRREVEPGITLVFIVGTNTKYKDSLFMGFALMKDGANYEDADMAQRLKPLFVGIDGYPEPVHEIFWDDFAHFEGKAVDILNRTGEQDNYFKLFDPEKFDAIVNSTIEQALAVFAKLKSV